MVTLRYNFFGREGSTVFESKQDAMRWVYCVLIEEGEIEENELNDMDFDTIVADYAETLPVGEFLEIVEIV